MIEFKENIRNIDEFDLKRYLDTGPYNIKIKIYGISMVSTFIHILMDEYQRTGKRPNVYIHNDKLYEFSKSHYSEFLQIGRLR